MSELITINEEMRPEKEWFEQAKQQTLETLPEFVRHVMNDYGHDYGTVCHAISACALAAAWAANREESGGITGFQAGFVMWDFVRQWSYPCNKTGLRILNYDDMLYPQYSYKFEKTLSPEIWEDMQKVAREELETDETVRGYPIHPAVIAHWQSIADGVLPFGFVVKEND